MNCREKIDNLLAVKALKLKSIDDLESRMAGGDEKTRVGDQTIRKAYNENRELTGKIQRRIIARFGLNPDWWETGEGPVFLEKGTRDIESLEAIDYKLIPLYDVMAMGGTKVKADLTPVSEPSEWIYPGTLFKDADAVITVYGDSMWRDYPHMCRVACREVKNRNLILWGQVYAIETSEYRVVKRVRRGETKDTIRGESINTVKDITGREIHEHLEIRLDDIARLFLVIGKVDRVQA